VQFVLYWRYVRFGWKGKANIWEWVVLDFPAFMFRLCQIDVLRCPLYGKGTVQEIEVIVPTKQRAIPTKELLPSLS
jgi:hypothetical protein